MSTIIRNGYRLAAGVNPLEFLHTLRATLETPHKANIYRLIAEYAEGLLTTAEIAGKRETRNLLFEARDLLLENASKGWGPLLQTSVRLGCDPVSKRTLLLFGGSSTIREAFVTLPDVEEYGYWNDADRPKDISANRWATRKKAWHRMLPGAGVPGELMASWSVDQDNFFLKMLDKQAADQIIALLPHTEARARSIILDRACTLALDPGASVSTMGFARAHRRASALMDTPAVVPIIDQVAGYLEPTTRETYLQCITGSVHSNLPTIDEAIGKALAETKSE